jgi:glycosyltransferase involved in cell wall biosynthesis
MVDEARVRVLHVLGRMQPGGVEMRLLELMQHVCPHEFHVDICAVSGLTGSLDAQVRARGGAVVPLPLNVSFVERFGRLLRQGRYHVVHSHVLYASGAIVALAARAGISMRIAHFRNVYDNHRSTIPRRAPRRVMLHLIDRYATDIIASSEWAMSTIWGGKWHDDARCRIIYDGIDLARFQEVTDSDTVRMELGIPTGAHLFAHVANALPVKNHARVLDVFAEIRRRAASSWLVLAGTGTDDPVGPIARGIQARGLQSRVVALGVRDDIPRLLNAVDTLLLPSLHEALPGVVLEACAAGVPVLATDLPSVREIASRLRLVRVLPLSASDTEWADVAAALRAEATREKLKETASDSFRSSVFSINRAVEAHRELWNRRL